MELMSEIELLFGIELLSGLFYLNFLSEIYDLVDLGVFFQVREPWLRCQAVFWCRGLVGHGCGALGWIGLIVAALGIMIIRATISRSRCLQRCRPARASHGGHDT
jgi:hypothetical protein